MSQEKPQQLSWKVSDCRSGGSSGAPALHCVPVGTAPCPCNLSGSGVNFVVGDFTVCVSLVCIDYTGKWRQR